MRDGARIGEAENIPPALIDAVVRQCAGPVPGGCGAIVEAVREEYNDALRALLFYGSCSRGEAVEDSIVDMYAIVDDYRKAYKKSWLARANAWLPPNVFYREIPGGKGPVRVKLSVISLADFRAGISNWFHSYLWGRFAQPVRIPYTRDQALRHELYGLLARAALTLLKTTIPTLPEKSGNAEAIWTRALSLSYSAEYRPEAGSRAASLVGSALADYGKLLEAAAPALGELLLRRGEDDYQRLSSDDSARKALFRWRLRRWQGRVLSVLRLMKASLTFANGVDYAAWKINRHTGVRIEVTPGLRRHPLLFGWRVFRQLIKRGVLH